MARSALLLALVIVAITGAAVSVVGMWLAYGALLATSVAPLVAAVPPLAALAAGIVAFRLLPEED